MASSRGAFLAGTAAAAVAAPTMIAAASAADVAAATRGMTLTTLRDGNADHVGVRTPRGIVDVARAAQALGVASPPRTVDDVIAGRGDVAALPRLVKDAPASAIRSESSLQSGPVVTAGNDFTARDPQQRVSQWMTGKTPDEFAPIGPWLVTADQTPNPQTLTIQTWVNDEKTPRQDANTAQMIFNCAHILSYTSTFITLSPGDVIFTGTPSGVITGYPKDKQVWLKPGDRVRTTISKIGELHFTLT